MMLRNWLQLRDSNTWIFLPLYQENTWMIRMIRQAEYRVSLPFQSSWVTLEGVTLYPPNQVNDRV